MKFTVIDRFGNAKVVEAEDIYEAIDQRYNNHYGYDHILAVAKVEEQKRGLNDE